MSSCSSSTTGGSSFTRNTIGGSTGSSCRVGAATGAAAVEGGSRRDAVGRCMGATAGGLYGGGCCTSFFCFFLASFVTAACCTFVAGGTARVGTFFFGEAGFLVDAAGWVLAAADADGCCLDEGL